MVFELHIIAFDVPYPANYGGVIDVFYKIRALHQAGVSIHLHCFEEQRGRAAELDALCTEVIYYPRASGIRPNLSILPYIVETRRSDQLIHNLLKDNHPILFEGLHTCFLLNDIRIKSRVKIYRESNIEHHYYYHLFRAEKNLLKRAFFLIESLKLKRFQEQLQHANIMLTVSEKDTLYLQRHFPGKQVVYLPSFHREDAVNSLPGLGTYALYHGKLSVPENSRAAEFLIQNVWNDEMPELVIAGLNPPAHLTRLVAERSNIRLVGNPSEDEMFDLIQHAHVNIMVTFQATGLKLKLLNALFLGRFALVNPEMVAGTTLAGLCSLAIKPAEFREAIDALFNAPFTASMIRERENVLFEHYSNQKNCQLLLDLLTLS